MLRFKNAKEEIFPEECWNNSYYNTNILSKDQVIISEEALIGEERYSIEES